MKKVFSFTLFGNQDKYCKGLLKNITIIEQMFSDWEIWVYCGEGITPTVIVELNGHPHVKLIPTGLSGMINKFYRFFAIDDPEVAVCIIRDADSRIYERDQRCIQDFLFSDKLVHIIRDHPNHHHRMMAGMWGIKQDAKSHLPMPITLLFHHWRQNRNTSEFWNDTEFLCEALYPYLCNVAMIHDETQTFEPFERKTSFHYPLLEKHFIGQVYEYDEQGNEYPKFDYKA